MKGELKEFDGSYSLEFEAETLAEAALLVRFALSATTEIRAKTSFAHKNGIQANLIIGRAKQATSMVRRAKQ